MRIHTLQSVWSAPSVALTRHLFEGGADLGVPNMVDPTALGMIGHYFCEDAWLNQRLVRLHQLARSGYGGNIQQHIDAYLPAVAYLQGLGGGAESQRAFARRMVLCITDTPQAGTLPDLGCILRCIMLGYRQCRQRGEGKSGGGPASCDFPFAISEHCYATCMMMRALPCIKIAVNRKPTGEMTGWQIGLNVLLGFLLGLYPSAVKFPPFPVRVAIYTAVHRLLTCGGGRQFCTSHPMLMTMAFMEYCAFAIPSYLPVEHEIMLGEPGMSAFFVSIPVAGDVFRQEMFNGTASSSSMIQWALWEKNCESVVDKQLKACKNKGKQKRDSFAVPLRVSSGVVDAFSCLPYVRPYGVHLEDGMHKIIGSELAMIAPSCPSAEIGDGGVGGVDDPRGSAPRHNSGLYETVAAMQRLLSVSALPENLIKMQLRSLGASMRVCERSALDGMMVYICVACGISNNGASRNAQVRGQCRLDGEGFSAEWIGIKPPPVTGFICSHCNTPSVVAVNTLGRVVTLRSQCFFLAPCCCTVQIYRGSGTEFQSEYCLRRGSAGMRPPGDALPSSVTLHSCPHQKKGAQRRPQRPRCEVCKTAASGAVTPEAFSAVDHLTGCMQSIRLCARHAPRPEALKHVANWRQLMDEVGKRDKPLFASCRK